VSADRLQIFWLQGLQQQSYSSEKVIGSKIEQVAQKLC